MAITEIAITAHDGDRWPALRTIPNRQPAGIAA
jgi:hypothetical protein